MTASGKVGKVRGARFVLRFVALLALGEIAFVGLFLGGETYQGYLALYAELTGDVEPGAPVAPVEPERSFEDEVFEGSAETTGDASRRGLDDSEMSSLFGHDEGDETTTEDEDGSDSTRMLSPEEVQSVVSSLPYGDLEAELLPGTIGGDHGQRSLQC